MKAGTGLGLPGLADRASFEDAVQTLLVMEVFKGEGAQSQETVSTRKRAGPETGDAAMKRPRKEQTSVQAVSSCGKPVHRPSTGPD